MTGGMIAGVIATLFFWTMGIVIALSGDREGKGSMVWLCFSAGVVIGGFVMFAGCSALLKKIGT